MEKKRVIDLFAGCGGLSKGFEKAGFEIVGFVENWKPAIETHKINFPNSVLITEDITKITVEDIKKINKKLGRISGIIGGPPCQGFSTMGKMDPKDYRNFLFYDFIKFVKILNPDFFVIENVKSLTSFKNKEGKLILKIIIKELETLKYNINYNILKSSDYGIPQIRERLFILGSKKKVLNFPKKTHDKNDLKLKKWVTIDEAINNLPELNNNNLGSEELKINLKINSNYQKEASKDNKENILRDHQIIKQREIDLKRGSFIPEGKYIRSITPGGLKNNIFPDKSLYLKYNESKQQKYWRLNRKEPGVTVLTDWGTMRQKIHFSQNRPFSVREVARFQSFPDNFVFKGKLNEKYRQIGNAVPVLLAKAVAEQIMKELY